uniref:O-methyltransferase domain-containing protein n=1 Tax=Kalanchoe fedtschenkoi TaxID=63787 RepID=A0A7N1A5N5_KALFE
MAGENNNQVSNPPDGIVSCSPSAAFVAIRMALKAAIELNVFNIMAESGPLGSQLSALQIASKIPTTNPDKAVTSLHRIPRFHSINSFLTTSLPVDSDKEVDRLFGLTPMTADMMVSKDGAALPIHGLFVLTNTEKEVFESFDKLKNFVLEPEGATWFYDIDYLAQRPDSRLSILFDQSMGDSIKMFFDAIVKVYGGFSEVVELLNVGGNDGSALEYLISVYPKIKGVNFDLPHVIARAPNLKVKHVAGDMFETLPNSKTVLLKAGGKVIVLEMVIPHDLNKNKAAAMQTVTLDFNMLTKLGGKERTVSEFRDLALAAGFSSVNFVPTENLGIHVFEFLK